MKNATRALLLHAADIIALHADELRHSNVCNGAWRGAGVLQIRNEWAHMIRVVRELREAAKCS